MMVARAYRLKIGVIMAWPATDMLVASWDLSRERAESHYDAKSLALYAANMTAVGFHEPPKLRECANELQADAPEWVRPAPSSGSWDDFAAMARAMGAG